MTSGSRAFILCMVAGAAAMSYGANAQSPNVADLPKASECATNVPFIPTGGASVPATIRMNNKGGWCWLELSATQSGARYVPSYSVPRQPAHGQLMMGQVGQKMRVAYKPTAGFAGNDSFSLVNETTGGERTVSVTVAP